jgi:hypothetical protein
LPVAALIETADGVENLAAEPTPLASPAMVPKALPPPANDVTTPVAVLTARMRLLPKSATNTLWLRCDREAGATVQPRGLLNRALVPVPSTAAPEELPPASVLTVPVPMSMARTPWWAVPFSVRYMVVPAPLKHM